MTKIIFAVISPHPPIILPSVGSPEDRVQVKNTIEVLEKLGKKLIEVKPDSIIISSPHPDWGIKVPLHFLNSNRKSQNSKLPRPTSPDEVMAGGQFKIQNYQTADNIDIEILERFTIYPILTTFDSPKQHYKWGKEFYLKIKNCLPVEASAKAEKLKIALIASGDLSHCLKANGPYGFHPDGPKFDEKLIQYLRNKDIESILTLGDIFPGAGECGLRSFCFLLGMLEAHSTRSSAEDHSQPSGQSWQPEILSYEGPFGVGYLVANFKFL